MIQNQEDAYDITQENFLKFIKELFQRAEAQSGPDQKQLLKACQYLQKEILKAEDKKYKILCNVSLFHDLVI